MNRKGLLILMICISMLLPCFAGCDAGQDQGTTAASAAAATQSTQATEGTDAPTEARLPAVSGDAIRMYYDDRLPVAEISGSDAATVEISQQEVTSKLVGSDAADGAVVYCQEQSKTLIAVGTGTAVVMIDE